MRTQLNLLSMLAMGALSAACAESETWVIISSHLITEDYGGSSGFACARRNTTGGAASGAEGDEFWITETLLSEGAEIRWGGSQGELGSRFFDAAFFENHQLEQFFVKQPDGGEQVYAVWGADLCEQCPSEHLDEYVDYPGAIVQCNRDSEAADAGAALGDDPDADGADGSEGAGVSDGSTPGAAVLLSAPKAVPQIE